MYLFVSTNDHLGGAATVTLRLVRELRRQGVDARMLVARKDGSEMWVDTVSHPRFLMAKTLERTQIICHNGLSRTNLWKVSTASTSSHALSHPWMRQAHTVVLGWFNQGLLSLRDIDTLLLSGKKVMWWTHDLWAATGICHIPPEECNRLTEGCGHCPLLSWQKGANDLSATTFHKKQAIWGDPLRLNKIRFLAVSDAQRRLLESSPLLSGRKVALLEHPYELPPSTAASATPSGKTIVMGAARLDDPVKDLPTAVEALNILVDRHSELTEGVQVIFFGQLRDRSLLEPLRMTHRYAGPLTPNELQELYSHSDIVLSSSLYETAGATLIEGMAAGATPVAFAEGGRADILAPAGEGGVYGYLADEHTPQSLARALAQALRHPLERTAQRAYVASRFSAAAIARRFLTLTHSQ